jgi:uncharacterized membrane protein
MALAITITVILGLAFLVVVCAAVAVLLVRILPGRAGPEEILRERYARGEIDTREYEEMRVRIAPDRQTPRAA